MAKVTSDYKAIDIKKPHSWLQLEPKLVAAGVTESHWIGGAPDIEDSKEDLYAVGVLLVPQNKVGAANTVINADVESRAPRKTMTTAKKNAAVKAYRGLFKNVTA